MPITVALVGIDVTRRKIRREYEVTPTGAYPTGGETLNLLTVSNPQGLPRRFPGQKLLSKHAFNNKNQPNGYTFEILQAAANPTNANFLLKVWASDGTELSGNYPAGLLADNFEFDILTSIKEG